MDRRNTYDWKRERELREEREIIRQREEAHFLGHHYFRAGAGRTKMRDLPDTVVPPGEPYAEAYCRSRSGGLGSSFHDLTLPQSPIALSCSIWASEGPSTYRFQGENGLEFTAGLTMEDDFSVWAFVPGDYGGLAATLSRLFATALGSRFRGLRVQRPDWRRYRDAIWEEHLREDAALAERIGWSGHGPYDYLDEKPPVGM